MLGISCKLIYCSALLIYIKTRISEKVTPTPVPLFIYGLLSIGDFVLLSKTVDDPRASFYLRAFLINY
jgi:hypothetical protein